MTSVNEYKRLENKLVQKAKKAGGFAGGYIVNIFKAIGKFLTRRYTLVFVPHSEKRVYNLHITVFSFFCFFLVLVGVIGSFFWFGSTENNTRYVMTGRDSRLMETQASLDLIRDETAVLIRNARNFEDALSVVLSTLDISAHRNRPQDPTGDLASILGIQETPAGSFREIDELQRLSAFFAQAEDPIREIVNVLNSQSSLLTEIPSIWPLRGGAGRMTMLFGQNIHPITRQWHMHTGIDFATNQIGNPVVATADGQVVTLDFDSGYGFYILLRHRNGYFTRYAHLHGFAVELGQRVQQGQTIGYLGNSGISTGPHLHYEVYVGSDVVDPYRFVTMRSSMMR